MCNISSEGTNIRSEGTNFLKHNRFIYNRGKNISNRGKRIKLRGGNRAKNSPAVPKEAGPPEKDEETTKKK